MKAIIVILGLVALVSAAPKSNKLRYRNLYKTPSVLIEAKPGPRIISGQEATPHSIPFQVFLEVYGFLEAWYCGGSLISQNYVVTAGHCGDGAGQAYITLGAHNPQRSENTQVQLESEEIIVHEGWDDDRIVNDICVIRLPRSVSLNDAINVIPLPRDASNDYAGVSARLSGWGLTNGHGKTISDVLEYADDVIISHSACNQIWGNLDASIICTSGKTTSVCGGDSGGPLVADGVLVGVTSFATEYCDVGYPSGFTRVTSFLDWIARNTDV